MAVVEVKRFPHYLEGGTADLPSYATPGSAAIDLYACFQEDQIVVQRGSTVLVPSGIAINIQDPNVAAFVLPRSGLGHKDGIVLGNLVGLVDSDYQGEVMVSVWNRNHEDSGVGKDIVIKRGTRLAQLMFVPYIRPSLVAVDVFSTATKRGEGGFGSTGV